MSEVISTHLICRIGYRFRTQKITGKQILQLGYASKDWDTNTGHDVGPEYTTWIDADRWKAEEMLKDYLSQGE